MTVKELNLLKRKMWDVLMENPEISNKVKTCGINRKVKTCGKAMVYDIADFNNHAIMIVNQPTQVNDNTISDLGINAEKCTIKRLFTVSNDHDIVL